MNITATSIEYYRPEPWRIAVMLIRARFEAIEMRRRLEAEEARVVATKRRRRR